MTKASVSMRIIGKTSGENHININMIQLFALIEMLTTI